MEGGAVPASVGDAMDGRANNIAVDSMSFDEASKMVTDHARVEVPATPPPTARTRYFGLGSRPTADPGEERDHVVIHPPDTDLSDDETARLLRQIGLTAETVDAAAGDDGFPASALQTVLDAVHEVDGNVVLLSDAMESSVAAVDELKQMLALVLNRLDANEKLPTRALRALPEIDLGDEDDEDGDDDEAADDPIG